MGFFSFVSENIGQIGSLTLEHIKLTFIAVLVSILVGVPLGILISYVKKLSKPILGVANIIQAVPSLALLGLSIPLLGIGELPSVVMVVIYSLLPIIKNTYTGLENIDPLTLEAARGIGLTKPQRLFKIRLPIALPVIMAGVRISAVTAVGLMTMAAFIGAGGLGYMIFSGIRTVDNAQILAGAIPACLLALFVDWIIGMIEKLVTPISLQKDFKGNYEQIKKSRRTKKIILGAFAAIIVAIIGFNAISGAVNKNSGDTIVVASKDYTEQIVLMNLYSDIIEDRTDLNVVRKENLGGTQVCLEAIQRGEIDMYIDYTGTQFMSILKHDTNNDTNEVYEICKKEMKEKYGLDILEQTVFDNTYTLAMKPEVAEEYGLEKISDLKPCASEFTTGTTLEFLNRKDGYVALCDYYGLNFKANKGMDSSPRYTALENDEVQIIDAFKTDGLLKKFNLKILEDDKSFFPPYHAIPTIREDTLEKYPEIEDACNELSAKLTEEVMQELNYRVDELGEKPEDVTRDWLVSEGIIEG